MPPARKKIKADMPPQPCTRCPSGAGATILHRPAAALLQIGQHITGLDGCQQRGAFRAIGESHYREGSHRRSPAERIDPELEQERPHRAGHLLSGGHECDRGAAMAVEPSRHIGHHRREHAGCTQKTDEQQVAGVELIQHAERGQHTRPTAIIVPQLNATAAI